VVDMGDDGKIADIGNRDCGHGRGIAPAPEGGKRAKREDR
jgi:hypothetical protein